MAVAVPVVRVCVSMTDIMTDLIQTATLVFHLSSYDFERLSSLLRILDRQCNTKCCRTRCKSDKWHMTNRIGHFCERQQNDELLAGWAHDANATYSDAVVRSRVCSPVCHSRKSCRNGSTWYCQRYDPETLRWWHKWPGSRFAWCCRVSILRDAWHLALAPINQRTD